MRAVTNVVAIVSFLAAIGFTSSSYAGEERSQATGSSDSNEQLGLFSIKDLSFVGAFALPSAKDEVSSLNFSVGIIEVNGDSLFIAGHDHHDAIAEFTVPKLVNSDTISDLHVATSPRQGFVRVLDRATSGNPESLDRIIGLELVGGSLVVNAVEYYDAPADNQLSTLIIEDASDLKSSAVSDFMSMAGVARASGWISEISQSWRAKFGGSHVSGHSSGSPIIARHSVGPSAFVLDLESVVAMKSKSQIKTQELLGFSLKTPLKDDLLNETGQNDLWTHISQARYGFIVPGTRTYATFGWSGGHQSGIGYKITQNDGTLCGGFCSADAKDNYNFYWLWDLNDLLKASKGAVSPRDILPYEYGQLDMPFQTDDVFNPIGGASFDPVRKLLYFSLLKANNEVGEFNNPPIIAAYKIDR